LGVAYDTYRKWRKQQKGAAYVRIGRKFYVTDPAKTAYIKSLEVQPVRSRR
jgi:hypothetical protein